MTRAAEAQPNARTARGMPGLLHFRFVQICLLILSATMVLSAISPSHADDSKSFDELLTASRDLEYIDPNQALDFAEQALSIAEAENNELSAALAHQAIGAAHYRKSQFEEAYIALQAARDGLIANNGPIGDIVGIEGRISIIHLFRGDYPNQMATLNQMLDRSLASDNDALKVHAYTFFAQLFSGLGDHEMALEYVNRSLALTREENNELYAHNLALITAGEVLIRAGQYDDGMSYLDEYFDFRERQGRVIGPEPIAYKALALSKTGRLEEAFTTAQRAYDVSLEISDFVSAALAMSVQTEILLARGEIDSAFEASLGTIQMLNRTDMERPPPAELRDSYLRTADIARQRGDIIVADEYQVKAQALSEEVFSEAKARAVAVTQGQAEAVIFRQAAQLSDLQLRQERLRSYIGYGLGLALLVVTLIAWRMYISERRLSVNKDTSLREIHHRTKNNLQMIVSILSMDIRRSEQSKAGSARSAFKSRRADAINRARSMALVHDHMYGQHTTATVRIDKYLDDLIQHLTDSLGSSRLKVSKDIVSREIDVDIVTPMGLLVCELITNAIKHAFEFEEGGEILLSLREGADGLDLTMRDSGRGFDTNKPAESGLGMQLIEDLATQLQTKPVVESSANGTTWVFKGISGNAL